MAKKFIENITLENAKLLGGSFKNFSGRPDKYNSAGGKRTFHVVIPEELVSELQAEGWNIKRLKPRPDDDPEDIPKAHLQVSVAYGNVPPKIYICTKKNKRELTEETISELDYVDMANVDLVIRPYQWELDNGNSGVKAYVKTMYVTIVEDAFASKYDYSEPEEDEVPWN